jgi:hypothetical protein
MELFKGFFVLIFIIGIVLLVVYFVIKSQLNDKCKNKIIYKYIPRTLKEDERQPVFVSQIFKTMFTQPSVWIDSIYNDSTRLLEKPANEYGISQM